MSLEIVSEVKAKMIDINAFQEGGTYWFEGYVSALCDNSFIAESEFELLVEWGVAANKAIEGDKTIYNRKQAITRSIG